MEHSIPGVTVQWEFVPQHSAGLASLLGAKGVMKVHGGWAEENILPGELVTLQIPAVTRCWESWSQTFWLQGAALGTVRREVLWLSAPGWQGFYLQWERPAKPSKAWGAGQASSIWWTFCGDVAIILLHVFSFTLMPPHKQKWLLHLGANRSWKKNLPQNAKQIHYRCRASNLGLSVFF